MLQSTLLKSLVVNSIAVPLAIRQAQPSADQAQKQEQVNEKGAAMNGTRVSYPTTACLNLALERNKQLFSEAHNLSCAALDLLHRPYMDAHVFMQYQERRQHADLKYHEAIEHLRSIMTEYDAPPSCTALR